MQPMAFLSRRPCVRIVSSVLVVALLSIPAASWALDSYLTRATLKGVRAVEVVIDGPGPDAERAGMGTFQLHADVTARLMQAQIPVVPRSPEYLYILVNALKESGGLYAYSIRVELNQPVSLIRDPTISVVAGTWGVAGGGILATDRLPEVRSRVADLVDTFIKAYREQNPRP